MESNPQAKPKQNGSKDEKGKNPSFPFYTGDWMKDPELRSVSAEARGLWIDFLCLMWDSSDRGYLVAASGKPWSNEHLARMTGVSEESVTASLSEMEEVGLFSRRATDGAIYNRRMAKKAGLSKVRSEAGSKGGSKSPSKPEANDEANPEAKTKQNGLPSSSSSSSPSGNSPLTPQGGGKRRRAPREKGAKAVFSLKTKIEAAEKEIREMVNSVGADAFGPMLSNKQKARKKDLESKISRWRLDMMDES